MTHTDPKVYLLAYSSPGPDYSEFVAREAEDYHPGAPFPAALVEQAGRICYDSYASRRPGGHGAYIARILQLGHGEVIEHATFTFCVIGISRNCATQLTRYRAGFSFCVRSSRYCDESEQPLLMPPNVKLPPETWDAIADHEKASVDLYDQVVEQLSSKGLQRKEARQAARYVLPEGRSTALVFTANARSLRHFLEQRCSSHADYEIRLLANRIHDKLIQVAPSLFSDYTKTQLEDGSFTLSTPNKKV